MARMAEDTPELVHYTVGGGVATITLDSPHNRNALSRQLVAELFGHLEAADADERVKVVVIRAEGKVFCSGADLSEATADGMEEGAKVLVAMQRRIVTMAKPVVTRIHGAVRAGGIGIVAASDIAVSADDATYALTEVKLGLTPAVISLTVLPRLTSRAAALTCLTGDAFDGTQAAEMGLVTRAVPEAQLDDVVSAVVASLRSGSAQGLRETKALLAHDLVDRIDARGDEVAALSARLFGSDAAREAMLAFLAKK